MLTIPCAPVSAQYSPLNERTKFCLFWLIIVLTSAPTLTHRPPIEWQSTSTPSSRSKGEVVCYSCFSKDFTALSGSRSLGRNQMPFKPVSNNSANATDDEDMAEIFQILREGGMIVPAVAERCADTHHTANPNFQGAKLRPCTNSKQDPGACVKFKGYYKGDSFIYRECWANMWQDPRPYQHKLSGNCFNDEMVQSFVGTHTNTICFCEDDLCNGGQSGLHFLSPMLLILTVSVAFISQYCGIQNV
ncbi:hypothetical protein Ddc_11923 [Ditylenchus destructor]|nr:hypothetical protein Ddc_11923 [Ditylenchus destructor]